MPPFRSSVYTNHYWKLQNLLRRFRVTTHRSRAGLRDSGALGKVIWGGPPKEVVANHIYEQKLSMHRA